MSSDLIISVCGQLVNMCVLRFIYVTLFHPHIRKVLLNQLNIVSGEVLIFLCLILFTTTVQPYRKTDYKPIIYIYIYIIYIFWATVILCCFVYGSQLWSLKSTVVESMLIGEKR